MTDPLFTTREGRVVMLNHLLKVHHVMIRNDDLPYLSPVELLVLWWFHRHDERETRIECALLGGTIGV